MRKILLSAAFTACSLAASAVAPYPGAVNYTQPDGTTVSVTIEGNEYGRVYRTADGKAMIANTDGRLVNASPLQVKMALQDAANGVKAANEAMASRGVGLHSSYVAHTGSPNVCVVLVQFSDVKFSVSNPATYFNNWLNQENYSTDGNSGSVRDYFKAQSGGRFTPNFDVYGPVTLGSKRSAYASTNAAYKMVTEACKSLESSVDFTKYDTNGDGVVDNVYVIFAGQGSNYGASNAPWPHNSTCSGTTRVDGKTLNHYSCTSEQGYDAGSPDGIGTFIHEFGHALGFPDYYNTNTTGNDTPYVWSIMDRGNYIGKCKTPIGYSAFERHAMDWLEYTELGDPAKVVLRSLADYNFAVKIETGRSGDYYILENRPATGWDRGIYGGGMLVWHIDASDQSALSNNPNNDSSHLRVRLVRADNNDSADSFWGDAWPGSSGNTSFTSSSTPAMVRWNASTGSATTAVDKPVTNIKNANNVVTFDFRGGSSNYTIDPDTQNHTIYVMTSGGGTVCINDNANLTSYTGESGKSITLCATANSGYTFEGWVLNGTTVSTQARYTLTVGEATAGTYTAKFKANTQTTGLTITVTSVGGGYACINGDPDVTTYSGNSGQRVLLNAVRQGGTFEGWEFNGAIVSKYTSAEITLSAETAGTYTARFTTPAPELLKEYAHLDGTVSNDRAGRGIKTLTVTDITTDATLTVNGPGGSSGRQIYTDNTASTLNVNPGDVISITGTADMTEWMHSYVYIDLDNDGQFDVDATNYGAHKDLMAHTGYQNTTKHASNDDSADPTTKSDGSAVDHGNFLAIPSFTLPDDLADGVYRLRVKVDWNNNHPYGRCEFTLSGLQKENYLVNNGGSIIDLTLNVQGLAGIDGIEADNSEAINLNAPDTRIYTLMGQEVTGTRLQPGVYIVRNGSNVAKIFLPIK